MPLDVDAFLTDHGAQDDAAKIEALADARESAGPEGYCGLAGSYHVEFIATLRFWAARVREGREPWPHGFE